ncbi:MAG TPA: YggS family pyridoxal phosphate-dependent enzyme [Dehalococcoidales bacterium]|nr:YggS family pyridoxal phosphate-dependent enzyme [Dehalococcoidales bacterium]
MGIRENSRKLLEELPDGVELVAAAKTRTADEVLAAVEAGIAIIGQNYVQEAEAIYPAIGNKARWHFIGHLQKNKVKKAVTIFDMIETVDSVELAQEIDRHCALVGKVMPVLIEINSGREPQKAGVLPEKTEELIRAISSLPNIKVMGLMTMGPRFGNPEDSRPYFITTRKIFKRIEALAIPNVDMKYLSMGMTNSYPVALEEGANLVRIGTRIFGERS